MVGKNQSSWQSTKGGTIENLTTLEGGGSLGILQSLMALRFKFSANFFILIILYLL